MIILLNLLVILVSDPISSEPISEPNTMEEGRERTTSFHERDFPSDNTGCCY